MRKYEFPVIIEKDEESGLFVAEVTYAHYRIPSSQDA
jgi:hypothetical protein